jgi:hypothetical protein
MSAIRLHLVLFTLLLSGHSHADWESSVLPSGFQTENSLQKALATANGSRRSVIVYYTRTNCPPCNVLQGRLKNPDVGGPYLNGFVFTVVWGSSMGNAERESYRQRFNVQGAPTWIVYRADGRYLCTSQGGFASDAAGAELYEAITKRLASSAPTGTEGVPRACIQGT